MGMMLEVEKQVKSGCGVERPGSLVEVGDDEWCKMVIEFVDVDSGLERSMDVGDVVYMWGWHRRDRGSFAVVFVCPPLIVKVGEGDLAAIEALKVVVVC